MSIRFLFVLFLLLPTAQLLHAQCDSQVGVFTEPSVELCADETGEIALTITSDLYTGGNLDADDVLAFYFTIEDDFDPDDFLFATQLNSTEVFNLFGEGNVFAVVGNDDGSGLPDLNDPCTVVSTVPLLVTTNTLQLFTDQNIDPCTGDGTLVVEVLNSSPPYTFQWSNGATTQVIQGPFAGGDYFVTVTNALGCSAVASFMVDLPQGPLAVIAGPNEIDCTGFTQTLQAIVTGGTAPYFYSWSTGETGAVIALEFPGFYTVLVTDQSGCTTQASFVVSEDSQIDPITIDSVTNISCAEPIGYVYGSFDPDVPFVYFNINNSSATLSYPTDSTFLIEVTNDLHYFIEWGYGSGNIACFTGVTDYGVESVGEGCAIVSGSVLRDQNDDCLSDGGDTPLEGRLVRVKGAEERFAFSEPDGSYTIFTQPDEAVEVEIVSSHDLYFNCGQPVLLTTPGIGETATVDLLQQTVVDCPLLNVQISAGIVRRCFDVPFYGSVCNLGTETAENAYIEIELDTLFTVNSANPPMIDLGGGLYRIDLGDLAEQECISYSIQTTLSCSAQLGQTLCNDARVFPNDPCPPADPDWNGASVAVSGDCVDGQNRFVVENIGTGDMLMPSGYIVIEDAVVLMQQPVDFQLPVGESLEVLYPGDGSAYRLEATQVPDHPGVSMPSYTIEGCNDGSGPNSWGFVLQFPQNDFNQTVDIECREVIGAYDPNDIQVFPRGVSDQHFIEPGTPLEYLIRFQNTGTDTAFNVYIEDVLDPNLDLTTLRPLISSHDYHVDFIGGDTVHFVFDDILLVDSFTNEAGSHGFIRYAIDMKEDLPLGTVLKAKAGIYFDFNEPVVTNEVFNTLGEDFLEITSTQEVFMEGLEARSFPNPTTGIWHLELDGRVPKQIRFELRDVSGRLLRQLSLQEGGLRTDLSNLTGGVYFYRVVGDMGVLVAGKILVGN